MYPKGRSIIPDDYQSRLYDRAIATRPKSGECLVISDVGWRSRQSDYEIRDVYLLGDIEKAQFIIEREDLKRDLALLDMRAQCQASRLHRLAEPLAYFSSVWSAALPEQRHRLARLLFEEIAINDEQVVAIKSRPELVGYVPLDYKL